MRTRTPASAPGKGLFALNDDIIHSILYEIPNPRILSIVAMTCKGLFKYVYGENAKTILRAVTANASGSPACLEPAVRAVRIQRVLEDYPKRATADIAALGDVQEDIIPQDALKPWLLAALDDRLAVGRALEVVYSRSCKDRATSSISLLSPSESDRFQSALHRAWLVSSLYSHDVLQHARNDPKWRTGTTCNQLLFALLPADELAAFATIWRWMASTLYDTVTYDWSRRSTRCAVLERGPRGALWLLECDTYEEERYRILQQDSKRIHLDALLSECDALLPAALRAPNPPLGADTAILTRGILSTVVGAKERCTKCRAKAGLALWSVENASTPPRDLQRRTLDRHFDRMQEFNFNDIDNLRDFLERIEESELERIKLSGEAFSPAAGVDIALGRVIREILEIEDAESLVERGPVLPDGNVTPQSLLCAKCLGKVLDARLLSWWRKQTYTVSQVSRNLEYMFEQLECLGHR